MGYMLSIQDKRLSIITQALVKLEHASLWLKAHAHNKMGDDYPSFK